MLTSCAGYSTGEPAAPQLTSLATLIAVRAAALLSGFPLLPYPSQQLNALGRRFGCLAGSTDCPASAAALRYDPPPYRPFTRSPAGSNGGRRWAAASYSSPPTFTW